MIAMGKSKEALLYLEQGLKESPKTVKKFIALNPSVLQIQSVADTIARYKKGKR